MDLAPSFSNADYSIVGLIAGVPMLDWPSDLFSDDAEAGEGAGVDCLLQFDSAFLPHAQPTSECHSHIAA
jgi:hypothetical protein